MSESAQPALPTTVDGAEAHSGDQALSGDLFILLEQQLEQLVGRHRENRKTIAELRDAIAERERQISQLEKRLADADELRGRAVSRIDGLIAKIDTFEREAANADANDATA